MPLQPKPLPPSLGEVFRTRDLTEHGESRGRAKRRDLDKSIRGIRSTDLNPDLITRCTMLALRLPAEAFFSHATAALVMGAPLPWRLETRDIHATVASPRRAPHASGVLGHSRTVIRGDVWRSATVRHSSPARVWCELGADLDLLDLVAVGDYLIHRRRGLATMDALAKRLSAGDRISQYRTLRHALPLLSDASESRPESHLRTILKLGGLPDPEINHQMVMTDGGGALRPDFLFRAQRLVLEYQGDYHRTKDQWRKDMTRRSRLETDGWRVHEMNADDLTDPREFCSRVRKLLERHG